MLNFIYPLKSCREILTFSSFPLLMGTSTNSKYKIKYYTSCKETWLFLVNFTKIQIRELNLIIIGLYLPCLGFKNVALNQLFRQDLSVVRSRLKFFGTYFIFPKRMPILFMSVEIKNLERVVLCGLEMWILIVWIRICILNYNWSIFFYKKIGIFCDKTTLILSNHGIIVFRVFELLMGLTQVECREIGIKLRVFERLIVVGRVVVRSLEVL